MSILETRLRTFKCKKLKPDLSLKSAGVSEPVGMSGPGSDCTLPDMNNDKIIKHFYIRFPVRFITTSPIHIEDTENTRSRCEAFIWNHDTGQTDQVHSGTKKTKGKGMM